MELGEMSVILRNLKGYGIIKDLLPLGSCPNGCVEGPSGEATFGCSNGCPEGPSGEATDCTDARGGEGCVATTCGVGCGETNRFAAHLVPRSTIGRIGALIREEKEDCNLSMSYIDNIESSKSIASPK
jgi:hypothetical protein